MDERFVLGLRGRPEQSPLEVVRVTLRNGMEARRGVRWWHLPAAAADAVLTRKVHEAPTRSGHCRRNIMTRTGHGRPAWVLMSRDQYFNHKISTLYG